MSRMQILVLAALLATAPLAHATETPGFAVRHVPVLGSVLTGGTGNTLSGLTGLGGAARSLGPSRLVKTLIDGPAILLDLSASGLNAFGALPGLSRLGTSHKGSASLLPGLQSLPAGGVPAAILVGLPVTAGSAVTTALGTLGSGLKVRGR